MPSSKIFDLVQIVRANFFKNRKKMYLSSESQMTEESCKFIG